MNIDFVGVQRLDEPHHYSRIVMVDPPRKEISRLRERGHAPYRCTRGFMPANGDRNEQNRA